MRCSCDHEAYQFCNDCIAEFDKQVDSEQRDKRILADKHLPTWGIIEMEEEERIQDIEYLAAIAVA